MTQADQTIDFLEKFERLLAKEQVKRERAYLSKCLTILEQRMAIDETISAIKFWQKQ